MDAGMMVGLGLLALVVVSGLRFAIMYVMDNSKKRLRFHVLNHIAGTWEEVQVK